MLIRYFNIFLFLVFIANSGKTQFHTPVFPDLSGDELLNTLRDVFTPADVLSFANSRDTMFAKIDAVNDSLTGVYSGHTIFLDPMLDPTQAAFMDGSNNGINTEHTYPQAFGASGGNARSDMHHLFPTRTPVNAARGNFPFADIPDNETQSWFYLNQVQSNIPTQNMDDYSEFKDGFFEPREDHKGNVARAMFYFYTIYNAQANAADPDFFEGQKVTLCTWHLQDPVDETEWNRSQKIANYQDGKPNPFVLDCTLPERSYCQEMMLNCLITSTNSPQDETDFILAQNTPNPFRQNTKIQFTINRTARYRLTVYNILGKEITTLVDKIYSPGNYEIMWRGLESATGGGLFFYRLQMANNAKGGIVKKMLCIPDYD